MGPTGREKTGLLGDRLDNGGGRIVTVLLFGAR